MDQTVREAHVLISEMSVVLIFNLIFAWIYALLLVNFRFCRRALNHFDVFQTFTSIAHMDTCIRKAEALAYSSGQQNWPTCSP